MNRSTKTALVVTGAAVGAAVGAYALLRRNRDRIDRSARRARQVSDQAERVANVLDGVRKALGPAVDEPVAPTPSE